MKLTKASDLRSGDIISVDGFWLELVRVAPTSHVPPKVMLLFMSGKALIADRDEEFLREER